MKGALFVILLTSGMVFGQASDKPPPSATQGQQNKGQAAKKPEEKKEQQPQILQSTKSGVTVITTGGTTSQPQGGDDKAPEWGAVIVAIFALLVAGGALLVAYRQMRMLETQLGHMEKALTDSGKMADAAVKSADLSLLQIKNTMEAERGFVKISHNPPGIDITDGSSSHTVFEVKNWGRTVATVSDVHIAYIKLDHGDRLPIPYPFPPHVREGFPNGILVPNEYFFTTKYLQTASVADTNRQLWVIGHVDYSDIYGRRWRGGYARKFAAQRGNNLHINSEAMDNFDRERIPGEGYDWDEDAIAKYYERHPKAAPAKG